MLTGDTAPGASAGVASPPKYKSGGSQRHKKKSKFVLSFGKELPNGPKGS
jgi:hypothetical protein